MLVLGGVAGQNSLACSVIPYSVAFNNAGTVTGNALQCSTISFVVTLPPAQSDNQITQAAFPYTVAMQDVALKKGYPFSASVLSYTVQFNSAGTIYDNNTDRQLFLSQLAYSATLQDITLPTVQKVCQSDTIPFSVSIRNVDLSWSGQARYLDGLVQSGGYLYPRKKRRWFGEGVLPDVLHAE